MVMTLRLPDKDSLELLEEVIEERRRGVNAAYFDGIAAEWRERVQEFIDNEGSPAVVRTWPAIASNKGRFLNLYGSPGPNSVQKPVLETLRKDHVLQRCPSCGEAGRPNTLDHYLPKEKYPHFCMTPLNLFPMCDACQTAKGTKTGDATSPKFFLHPYFDVFVAEQVVELSVEPPYDTPTFAFGVRGGLEPEEEALVETHIRELDMPARYNRFLKGQHTRMLKLAAMMRGTDQDVARSLEQFASMEGLETLNGWEHVYYRAVLDDDEFVEYLEEGALPAFI